MIVSFLSALLPTYKVAWLKDSLLSVSKLFVKYVDRLADPCLLRLSIRLYLC